MFELNAPSSISRKASSVTISANIDPSSLGFMDKAVVLMFYHHFSPRRIGGKRNLSYYQFEKRFEKSQIQSSSGTLRHSFTLPKVIPCTYKGKILDSKWFAEVKVDVTLLPDKRVKKEILVQRD